jgi:hypothetical protein
MFLRLTGDPTVRMPPTSVPATADFRTAHHPDGHPDPPACRGFLGVGQSLASRKGKERNTMKKQKDKRADRCSKPRGLQRASAPLANCERAKRNPHGRSGARRRHGAWARTGGQGRKSDAKGILERNRRF